MTIAEVLGDEEMRRREFPVVADRVYLAHAGVCPLPSRVSDAMRRYAETATLQDQEEAFGPGRLRGIRARIGQLVGAMAEEIALVGPTSLALSYVAAGVPLRKGDNVLIYHDDYPSNVYPWMALAERGVQVRLMNIRSLGRIRAIDVTGQVDEQTRLVALASCHFISGWRLDLETIGRHLRQRGILFCLDGIQTVGAFPTPAAHCDFMAADAHKWMLGPCAAGFLYVRKELQERLRPPVFGWHNVRCPNFVAQDELTFPPDSRRYEAGTANLVGLAGLGAALDLLLELGIDGIAAELLRKRARIVPALQERGFTVLEADAPPAHASAIVTFFRPGTDMSALHRKLTEAGVVTSLRADRSGQRYVRLSPHFYNTDEELDRTMKLL